MSDFPRAALESVAEYMRLRADTTGDKEGETGWRFQRAAILAAIKAYDELADRCVEDNTKHSLARAELRAQIEEMRSGYSNKTR
ncbi:MAG: hypothetical protein ACR652_24540 [Methylocystis sp.]|uniref:hypothetical protein n=1 Tax=Methylocystis sp. TaxID=1911079 RepID=UPI003DA45007